MALNHEKRYLGEALSHSNHENVANRSMTVAIAKEFLLYKKNSSILWSHTTNEFVLQNFENCDLFYESCHFPI